MKSVVLWIFGILFVVLVGVCIYCYFYTWIKLDKNHDNNQEKKE